MRAASTPHLLDAFMADVCQHVTLYGWWFFAGRGLLAGCDVQAPAEALAAARVELHDARLRPDAL